MAMEGINISPEIAAQQAQSHVQGHSLVLVAVDNEMAGAIELVPTIRPEARKIGFLSFSRGAGGFALWGDYQQERLNGVQSLLCL